MQELFDYAFHVTISLAIVVHTEFGGSFTMVHMGLEDPASTFALRS